MEEMEGGGIKVREEGKEGGARKCDAASAHRPDTTYSAPPNDLLMEHIIMQNSIDCSQWRTSQCTHTEDPRYPAPPTSSAAPRPPQPSSGAGRGGCGASSSCGASVGSRAGSVGKAGWAGVLFALSMQTPSGITSKCIIAGE